MENKSVLVNKFKELWHVENWFDKGFFTVEYLDDINYHWLQFTPPNDGSFYALCILYAIIMSFGLFGNGLVVYLYLKCKSLHTSANVLIFNLAISDGLMMSKITLFIYNSYHKGPVLGDIVCRIYGFIGGLSGTVSICILASISLDRFFVIKYPLNREYTKLRVKISLILSWIYGIVFSIIPVFDFGLGKYTPEGYLTSCSFDYLTDDPPVRYFILVFFFAAWVVPFAVITFSYANIVQVVLQRSIQSKSERESFRHVREEDKRKQELKLAIIVLGVIGMWVAAWTPYSIVALLGIFGRRDLISPATSMIPALFCKSAGAVDPYVYALSHPKFKSELRTLFCGKRKEKNKVWSTDLMSTKKNFEELKKDDVEEEVVEIEMKSLTGNAERGGEFVIDFSDQAKELKRGLSVSKLLCLKPDFSNRSSSVRKMARKWSMKARETRSLEIE